MVARGQRPGDPPADAVILFDGKDLSQWVGGDPRGVEHGVIDISRTGEISTRRHFGDCQLHLDWATPAKDDGGPMNWGNSGVFSNCYELQIIESHDSRIYADGIAGAMYGQAPPLVNASRKPDQWQTYDVVFASPRFDGDKMVRPPYVTVLWNGVLVQCHKALEREMAILGSTTRPVVRYYSRATTGPILLQYHNSAVRFRNIWVRPLRLDDDQ